MSRVLIAVATLVCLIEGWALRGELAPAGPRAWRVQRVGLPRGLRAILDPVFSERGLTLLMSARLLAAVGLLVKPDPLAVTILIFGQWAWAVRWRGTFNGGSDAMMMIVLVGQWIHAVLPAADRYAISFVAAHVILSFVVAGLAKLRNPAWRDGSAPRLFLSDVGRVHHHPAVVRLAGWLIMIFEVSFPSALSGPRVAAAYVGLALVFHVVNARLFGLNRFLWAWAAAYPALLALADH